MRAQGQGNGNGNSGLTVRVTALEAAAARIEAAIASLQSTIDGLGAQLAGLQTALRNETAARAQSDADTLTAARSYADQGTAAAVAKVTSYADSGDQSMLAAARADAAAGDRATLDAAKAYAADGDGPILVEARKYTDYALSRRLVFATSVALPSNLGGAAAADNSCQLFASRAGLPGTYKAWLTDSSASPYGRFYRGKGDYVLVDGTVIAHGWEQLTSGNLNHPISLDEHGNPATVNDGYVWTNTSITAGGISSNDCEDWTSLAGHFDATVGSVYSSDSGWTNSATAICGGGRFARMLYCFQQ